MSEEKDVTGLLLEWSAGSATARERLIPLVYGELRALASRSLRGERGDHTLQPTALVHEAYQKLVDQRRVQWTSRAHFYGAAAQLMRRILVDHARKHGAQRRGAGAQRVPLDEELPDPAAFSPDGVDLLALDSALDALSALDEGQARLVELRFFGGLSMEEAAQALGVSRATAFRDWGMARAFLHQRLSEPAAT